MKDVENALSEMLSERADGVVPRPGHREATMRRSRRRRFATAVTAGVVSLAVVAGGVGAARGLGTTRDVHPAAPSESRKTFATAGAYGFRSWAGDEYPYVARGFFRSAEWQLRAAAVSFEPDAYTRVTLQLRLGGSEVGASTGLPTLDGLFVTYHPAGEWAYGGDFAMVFGAAPADTETVDVLVDQNGADPQRIEAHVYEGYDAKTSLTADYYVAFVRAGATGQVVARDGEGREVDSAVIPQR